MSLSKDAPSLPSSSSSSSSSSVRLYGDVLSILFRFLDAHEFTAAVCTCREWHAAADYALCVGHTIKVSAKAFKLLAFSPHRKHFSSVRITDEVLISWDEFFQCFHTFPFLTALNVVVDDSTLPSPDVMLHLPTNLQLLTLTADDGEPLDRRVESVGMTRLFQALAATPSSHCLHTLILTSVRRPDLTLLASISTLTQLTLDGAGKWAHQHVLRDISTLSQLRSLTLRRIVFTKHDFSDAIFSLPNVKSFSFEGTSMSVDDMHRAMPNLTALITDMDTSMHLDLVRFTDLQDLQIEHFSWSREGVLVAALARCASLTHVGFTGNDTPTSFGWATLLTSPNLCNLMLREFPYSLNRTEGGGRITSLVLNEATIDEQRLCWLTSTFYNLESFTVRGARLSGVLTWSGLLEAFNDPSSMFPKLRKLKLHILIPDDDDVYVMNSRYWEWDIDTRFNTDVYRVGTPAPRLVGIEENPGPATAVQPSIASTFFRDGLVSILAFCDVFDFTSAARSCKYWLGAAVSSPSRGFRLFIRVPRKCSATVAAATSSLRHHICDLASLITPSELTNVCARFTGLTHMHVWLDLDSNGRMSETVLPKRLRVLVVTVSAELNLSTMINVIRMISTTRTLKSLTINGLLDGAIASHLDWSPMQELVELTSLDVTDAARIPLAAFAHLYESLQRLSLNLTELALPGDGLPSLGSILTSINQFRRLKTLELSSRGRLSMIQFRSLFLPHLQRFMLDRGG